MRVSVCMHMMYKEIPHAVVDLVCHGYAALCYACTVGLDARSCRFGTLALLKVLLFNLLLEFLVCAEGRKETDLN